MKQFLIAAILLYSGISMAADSKNEWQATSLTEELIKKIQQSQLHYKECVIAEMQKPAYNELKSKSATEEIIKQCEPALGKMREVYLEEKVPEIIADRHLKKMRIQTTRKLLKELMFKEAAKAAGQ
ncbi:MAG: hypothetical protein GQ569_10835 [Methylococcaceae bacterium]|nr:hypothetical protein [Methylococcaceae bacterium]